MQNIFSARDASQNTSHECSNVNIIVWGVESTYCEILLKMFNLYRHHCIINVKYWYGMINPTPVHFLLSVYSIQPHRRCTNIIAHRKRAKSVLKITASIQGSSTERVKQKWIFQLTLCTNFSSNHNRYHRGHWTMNRPSWWRKMKCWMIQNYLSRFVQCYYVTFRTFITGTR